MILLANGKVITRDPEGIGYLPDGGVVTDGGKIVEVGTTADLKAKYPQAEFVDARGGVIMPGLINAHTHIYSALARGLSIDGYNPTSFYEVLDLGFGKCKFALAGPIGCDFFKGYSSRTIASKYPNVARAFFESKAMDIRVIKIEGSVELAPLLGLSDAIVDIVETGSTLKENGLEVIETICDISARLIVNTASLKLRKQEIEALVAQMEKARGK